MAGPNHFQADDYPQGAESREISGRTSKIDPRLQVVDLVDFIIVAVIVTFRMHLHSVQPLHRKSTFPCRVKEVDTSNHIKAGNDEPTLLQIQSVDSYCAAVFISLKLNCAAPLLKGLQRLRAFSFAKKSVKDDRTQKKKRRKQQQGSQEY